MSLAKCEFVIDDIANGEFTNSEFVVGEMDVVKFGHSEWANI